MKEQKNLSLLCVPSKKGMKFYMKLNCSYIRLSKEDIIENKDYSNSIVNQIELIEEYAKRNNIHIDKKFIDDGYSGINFVRPAFVQMIKEIQSNNIGTIITKDFSRLGRNLIDTNFYITRFFPEHNVRYIAINDSYDSFKKNSDSEELIIAIKGILNDRYIKDTSRKIKDIKEQKTEAGHYMGFIAPYGYKKVRAENGKLTLVEDTKVSSIVKMIFSSIIEGKSRNDIAEYLNYKHIKSPMLYLNMTKSRGKKYYDKWTSGIIYRIVRNITYTGNTYRRKSFKESYKQEKRAYIPLDNRAIIKGTHPAIVDINTFMSANKFIRKNSARAKSLKCYEGMLYGLVRCGECGKLMNVSCRKKEKNKIIYFFYCTDGKNKCKECCNNKIIYINKLEEIVYFHIKQVIDELNQDEVFDNICKLELGTKKLKNKIKEMNNEIELCKVKIKELYLQKVSNQISLESFIQKRAKLSKQNQNLKKELTKIINDIEFANTKEQVIKKYVSLKNKNNLMKYIKNLVQEIRFFKSRKIEIKLDASK